MPKDIETILKQEAKKVDSIIKKYIDKKIDKNSALFLDGEETMNLDFKALEKTLSEPIWDMLERGGKRWRPALFLLVNEALGGNPDDVVDFVIIPEIIHNGTLIVDDIEDGSELRRGKPATWKIFGIDTAVNVGNAMYYLPLVALLKNKDRFDKEILNKIYETYVTNMINLSLGQAMDIAWHKGHVDFSEIGEKKYLQMCAYKTGALAKMSANIAAILTKADDKTIETIGKFAETIGVAFQIQDDILNLTSKKFSGKKGYGEDITEGKLSLPVIRTLQVADENDKKILIGILQSHTKNNGSISEAIGIIEKHDSIAYSKSVAKNLVAEAWKDVNKSLKESSAKEKLKAFANYLIERKI